MNKQLTISRLKETVEKSRKLKEEEFDFGIILKPCGTVGCYLGWHPTFYPELFYISPTGVEELPDIVFLPKRRKDIGGLCDYYGISSTLCEVLFWGKHQYCLDYDNLEEDATLSQVRNLWLQVIEDIEAGKLDEHLREPFVLESENQT